MWAPDFPYPFLTPSAASVFRSYLENVTMTTTGRGIVCNNYCIPLGGLCRPVPLDDGQHNYTCVGPCKTATVPRGGDLLIGFTTPAATLVCKIGGSTANDGRIAALRLFFCDGTSSKWLGEPNPDTILYKETPDDTTIINSVSGFTRDDYIIKISFKLTNGETVDFGYTPATAATGVQKFRFPLGNGLLGLFGRNKTTNGISSLNMLGFKYVCPNNVMTEDESACTTATIGGDNGMNVALNFFASQQEDFICGVSVRADATRILGIKLFPCDSNNTILGPFGNYSAVVPGSAMGDFNTTYFDLIKVVYAATGLVSGKTGVVALQFKTQSGRLSPLYGKQVDRNALIQYNTFNGLYGVVGNTYADGIYRLLFKYPCDAGKFIHMVVYEGMRRMLH